MKVHWRTTKPATIAVNENKYFMASMCSGRVRVMPRIALGCQYFSM
jgi:hypothetical protein